MPLKIPKIPDFFVPRRGVKKMPLKIPKVPFVFEEEEEKKEDEKKMDFEKLKAEEEIVIEKEMALPEEKEEEEEEEKVRWINLHTFLFETGVVFLNDELNSKNGRIILGLIMYLTYVNKKEHFYLFLIDCVYGSIRPAIAIHDAIQELPRTGWTIGCGKSAAMGSFILLSGQKRLAQPHARVRISEPVFETEIQSKSKRVHLDETKEQFETLKEYVYEIFVAKTGQPYDIIKEHLEKGHAMSAKEAQDYGIIDLLMTDMRFLFENRDDYPEENRKDTPGWR
jgi:ATP-dependent Clp protease protease subunit